MSLFNEDERCHLIEENESVWIFHDARCLDFKKMLGKSDLNGINLFNYDVHAVQRKDDEDGHRNYFVIDPNGKPIHQIGGLEEFAFWLDVYRYTLADKNNLIEMAYERKPECRPPDPREIFNKYESPPMRRRRYAKSHITHKEDKGE